MRSALFACATLCLPFLGTPSFAQSEFDGLDRTGSPYFVVPNVDARLDPLPLREVAVHVDISGVVADVTVTQLWENTGATVVDASYVFPLSTRAAVHALEMRIGGRRIVASIKEKQEAREIFEEAKRNGQTATLLEQSRPNMFTTRLANIQPGDVIEVELSYVELLRPTDGIYSLVVPKVVGPRYVSPAESYPDVPWSVISNDRDTAQPAPELHAWPISVSLRGGVSVQWAHSSTHPLAIEKDEDGGLEIDLAQDDPESVDATSDFVLDYALGGDALETGVLVQPDADGEGGHFLALVEPPERVLPTLVPNREYVFIVDTSGSMEGWPLALATTIVTALVADLDPRDRLNVLCFSGGAERLAGLSLPATAANKARAKTFLARQRGQGGTEILQALKLALTSPSIPGLARTFVVVTDGYVTVEAEAIDLIHDSAGDANVFAIGVGNGVNRHLLESIAHAGGAEPYFAIGESSADDIAERFIADARTPVLTHVSFSFEGFDAYDLEPKAIPTLYAARPLLVSGRYHGKASGTLVIRGETGEGDWQSRTTINGATLNPAVPLLWARERIARLSDFAGMRDAPNTKAEVTRLGLDYALVTQYTSFVAVDDARVAGIPAGDSNSADGGSLGYRVQQAMVSDSSFVVGSGAGGMGFQGGGDGGGGIGGGLGTSYGYGRIVGRGAPPGAHGGVGGKAAKPLFTLALVVFEMPARKAADAALNAHINRRSGAIRACLQLESPVAQTLVWRLVIATDGKPMRVDLESGNLSSRVATCITRTFRRLSFDAAPNIQTLRLELKVQSAE